LFVARRAEHQDFLEIPWPCSLSPLCEGIRPSHFEEALDFLLVLVVVFAETSQFGSEAIAGFRTVTALTMEESIEQRFEALLTKHSQKALKKAKWSTIVFAFSDSADLLCQALVFWYVSSCRFSTIR